MKRRFPRNSLLLLQLAIVSVFGAAFAVSSPRTKDVIEAQILGAPPSQAVTVLRTDPLAVDPLYDRPDFVSDEELAAVLDRVVPRFSPRKTKPNFVEHALRIWGAEAEFADPMAMSGRQMTEFLTDHARYAASWGNRVDPLLIDRPGGVAIRWGLEEGASVHHDHWLACLTEAGVHLDDPVFGPGRSGATIADVLQESLRDFRLEEPETEWTAMAFGLWLPPTRQWTGRRGRQFSFDLLAQRLLRGQQQLGVCGGTHRVYSLVLLLRLDDEFDILTDAVADAVFAHLARVRDLISASQWDDGRWPTNWPDGSAAARDHIEEDIDKQVIATGHHLEWLAIAPRELHPPDEQIRNAVRWVVGETTGRTAGQIMPQYTFYSHVGNALALWRKTRPAIFFARWQQAHAFQRTQENTVDFSEEESTEDGSSD